MREPTPFGDYHDGLRNRVDDGPLPYDGGGELRISLPFRQFFPASSSQMSLYINKLGVLNRSKSRFAHFPQRQTGCKNAGPLFGFGRTDLRARPSSAIKALPISPAWPYNCSIATLLETLQVRLGAGLRPHTGSILSGSGLAPLKSINSDLEIGRLPVCAVY